MNPYDVVVIGGGPAGLAASRHAALRGCYTLLAEKKPRLDAAVTCGEFIPSLEEARSLMPNVRDLSDFYDFASSVNIANITSSVIVYSPSNKAYEFRFRGLVLNKNLVNAALGFASVEAGVEIATSCFVQRLHKEKDCATLYAATPNSSRIMKAKAVVGADGMPSTVASLAGLKSGLSEDDLALCLNFLMTHVKTDENTVEMYFGNKIAPGGYAWIIPKGGGVANVGLGARLSRLGHSKNLQECLNTFREKHPVASRKLLDARVARRSSKIVPVGGIHKHICGEQVLLAGDSAGTVIPINGGGILTATISGRIAGETASRFVQGRSDLSAYQKAVGSEIGDELQRGLKYRKAADRVMRSDTLFEIALSLLGASNIGKVVQCRRSFLCTLLRLL